MAPRNIPRLLRQLAQYEPEVKPARMNLRDGETNLVMRRGKIALSDVKNAASALVHDPDRLDALAGLNCSIRRRRRSLTISRSWLHWSARPPLPWSASWPGIDSGLRHGSASRPARPT